MWNVMFLLMMSSVWALRRRLHTEYLLFLKALTSSLHSDVLDMKAFLAIGVMDITSVCNSTAHQILLCLCWESNLLILIFAAAYPYTDTDPFILESCPHVFFAGNQTKLEVEYYTQGKKSLSMACTCNV